MAKGLDKYEKDIEKNFAKQASDKSKDAQKLALLKAAKHHLKSKKSITLRVTTQDIEAIKIKASKAGLPYQTYINMLIHRDATHP